MKNILENIALIPSLSGVLMLSITAFLFKGICYLLIGSIAPFCLGLILLSMIIYGYVDRSKISRRIFRLWGWLLVFWAVGRLGIEVLFVLASITEEHIQNQFTVTQRLLSLVAILVGMFIIRRARFYQ